MFECHFVNGLYIQTSLAVNCLPATSDRYYHTYVVVVFLHPGCSVSLLGVWESGCISGRLPDDLGGFTCIPSPGFPHFYYMLGANLGLLLYGEVSVMLFQIMQFFHQKLRLHP